MMEQVIHFFYAHSASEDPDAIKAGCMRAGGVLLAKAAAAERSLRVDATTGREDFEQNARGDWEGWAQGVPRRRHFITQKSVYNMIIVPSEFVGRATATIVDTAVRIGCPVMLLSPPSQATPTLQRVTQVYPYDPDDWQGGFKCEVEQQLSLPFKEVTYGTAEE